MYEQEQNAKYVNKIMHFTDFSVELSEMLKKNSITFQRQFFLTRCQKNKFNCNYIAVHGHLSAN